MQASCRQCGNPVEAGGQCLACLMQLGISHGDGRADLGNPPAAGMPSLDALNAQFPQLNILRMIGRGGMGAIYHARQTALERDVALKVIVHENADDSGFIERFEREAKTLAKLSHPNIVTVYDFGRTPDGQAYLLMEYVDGINLREAIQTNRIEASEALDLVATICQALEYAHAKGVVHRDIKPENILLGEDGQLKVADFGIAKILDDPMRSPTLTATRQVLGSLHYLAPEQIEAPDQVDHRVDLYALGVMFYELLTGELPLGHFEMPSAIAERVDRRFDRIVMKTLSRKPAQRYQTATELGTDLRELRQQSGAQPLPVAEIVQETRSLSVPFSSEAYAGFAEALGMLHVSAGKLRLEYRVRDAILGSVKSGTKVIDIPTSKLSRVELIGGIFSSKVILTADAITTLGEFPNAESGRIEVKIKNSDYDLAAELVAAAGFPSSRSTRHEQHPRQVAHDSEQDRMQWTVFGVLLLLNAAINFGCLSIGSMFVMEDLRGMEGAAASIALTVVLGPIIVVQLIAGILSLFKRPQGLGVAAAIVSLLPFTPACIIGIPLGIWSLRWLRAGASHRRGQVAVEPRPAWGTTTLMFFREARWSKAVALANLTAVLLLVAAIGLYQYGVYPTTLKFRVVNQGVSWYDLQETLRRRLPAGSRIDVIPGTNGSSAEQVEVHIYQYARAKALERIRIEGNVALVWLTSSPAEVVEANGEPAASQRFPLAPSLVVGSELPVQGNQLESSVMASGEPIELHADWVRRLAVVPQAGLGGEPSMTPGQVLEVELSAKGRQELTAAFPAGPQQVWLGLLIKGVIEGIAAPEQISSTSLEFKLAADTSPTPEAVIAAIRGPVIPAELELIDE